MGDDMDIEGSKSRKLVHRSKSKIRSLSRARSKGSAPKGRGENMGLDKLRNKDKKGKNKNLINTADRRVDNLKPKWLFAGKMGNGTSRSR